MSSQAERVEPPIEYVVEVRIQERRVVGHSRHSKGYGIQRTMAGRVLGSADTLEDATALFHDVVVESQPDRDGAFEEVAKNVMRGEIA